MNKILYFIGVILLGAAVLFGCNGAANNESRYGSLPSRRYIVIQKQYVPMLYDLLSRKEMQSYLNISPELSQELLITCYPTKQDLEKYSSIQGRTINNDELHPMYVSRKIEDMLGSSKYDLLKKAILQVYGPEILFTSCLIDFKKQFGFSTEQENAILGIIARYDKMSLGTRRELGKYWIASDKSTEEITILLRQLEENEMNKDKDILGVFTESQLLIWDQLIAKDKICVDWPIDKSFLWKGF